MIFTGERYLPELAGEISYEHRHRYRICDAIVAGREVLDAACGEGYGSAMLARSAARVVGVDIDRPTIEDARRAYAEHGNLRFEVADCERLPFADASFDRVVSFETIEHLSDGRAFLAEVHRILRPDGLLILSTPNKQLYNRSGQQTNKFHLHEYDIAEIDSELKSLFPHVYISRQRFYVVSAIEANVEAGSLGEPHVIRSGIDRNRSSPVEHGASTAEYVIAICGKSDAELPELSRTFLLDEGDDLWTTMRAKLVWASSVDDEMNGWRQKAQQLLDGRDQSDTRLNLAASGGDGSDGPTATARLDQAVSPTIDDVMNRLGTFHDVLGSQRGAIERVASVLSEWTAAQATAEDTARLRADIADAAQALGSSERDLAAERTRADELRDRAAGLDDRLKSASTELDQLTLKCASLEGERATLLARVEAAEADLAAQAALAVQTAQAHRLLDARLGTSTSELRDKSDQLLGLRGRLAATQELIEGGERAKLVSAELRKQVQILTLQSQRSAHAQADLIDDVGRRMFVLHHRASVLAELSLARLRIAGRMLEGTVPETPRTAAWQQPDDESIERLVAWLGASHAFSPEWYRASYPDAAALGDEAALDHFIKNGLMTGRDPHPLISSEWLSRQLGAEPVVPLIAYVEGGRLQDPHPLFDRDFYISANPDVAGYKFGAFEHYLAYGARERRQPHPAFDPAWYESQLPESADKPEDLLADYLVRPGGARISPHPLFDAARYLDELGASRPTNPLLHYILRGEREGRRPHPLFEPPYYLIRNPDVAATGLSPFVHFLRYGAIEQRIAHPLFDPAFYAHANRDTPAAVTNPLLHYVLEGAAERRAPSAAFQPRAFWEAFPDLDTQANNPLVAFLDGRGLNLGVRPRVPDSGAIEHGVAPSLTTTPPQFRLPERLRELVETRFASVEAARVAGLMEVIDTYGDRPAAFPMSQAYAALAGRLKEATGDDVDAVDVSIVIPVHNALVYTMTCIVAVLEGSEQRSFEILIGDDASTDETPGTFSDLGGRVRLVRHEANLGFLANCNAVAGQARGRYVLLLNNDTIPLPGWLDTLVDLAERDPVVGLVGSKLLNGDGTLQEAGGILWNDGSAWNFGRNADPEAPAFNYVREVDYCSGASILVPTPIWIELGGFDPLFMPAYCEDSDLAFRVRAAGYRTVYQPFSWIVHHEGRSHGRDETSGIKAYQAANSNKLLERWADTLGRENWANGEQVFVARDRSRERLHILVVDHYVPQWDRDAGSRTMYHFLKSFVDQGAHVVFWPDNLYQDPVYTRPLQELGIEVIYGASFVGNFEHWLSENGNWIKYVLLSRPHIAINYIDAVKRLSSAKILYYGHDIHWRRLLDEYEVNGKDETLRLSQEFKDQEVALWAASDVVMYPSESERELVAQSVEGTKTVLAVPAWTFDEAELAQSRRIDPDNRSPYHLLFVGGFTHGPNVDGVVWFVEEILPLVREHDARFSLTIVGSNAPETVKALAGPGVHVAGFVSDEALASIYEEAGVAIAPLRFGGGVKGKVIEAFAKGIPIVTTPVGVQGIASADRIAFVAETANEFAAAVIEAAEQPDLARAKSLGALDFVAAEYSAAKLMKELAPSMPELAVALEGEQSVPSGVL